MEELKIIRTNENNIHEFGICAYKDMKQPGYKNKVEWLKKRFKEGLRYNVLYHEKDGVVGNIEYVPGEYAWRPVDARGYFYIHCLIIFPKKYKGIGWGRKLLDDCIEDARKSGANGVAVTTRKRGWMVGKELFVRNGFTVTDKAEPDYELMTLKLSDAPDPVFKKDLEKMRHKYSDGMYIFSSDQCPYTWKAIRDIGSVARSVYGIKPEVIQLNDHIEARYSPTVYGTFCIVYKGEVLADHVISATRFKNIMNKLSK
ncbi:MAG: YoaP domain-containing protein [Bacteroidales bacterium]|nr:YoaP domain-containing protein [Bacteroidales bacterium]